MSQTYEADRQYSQRIADMFKPDVAATVPPVTITCGQWKQICLCVNALAELCDLMAPHEVRDALIEGKLLHEAASAAWFLTHGTIAEAFEEDPT